MIALVLTLAVFAGVGIFWATRLDEIDAHLLHGPADGCHVCEDK